MNICFLVSNGHAGYKCTERMGPSECSKNLDDRAFSSYNMFFANIHSICLYVSNREFERHTSQLLNKLYEGAGAAQGVLQGVVHGLQVHQEQQQMLHHGISQMREEQSGLAEGLREGLLRLTAIQDQADTLQVQVNRTLAMEEELSRRQGDLAVQMSSLEQLEAQHAAASAQRWEQLLQRAAHMERRQAQYEALQEALAASSSQLLQQSGQLQGAIETVLVAQQRTSSLLGRVLGGQWTIKDLGFYAGSAGGIFLLTGSATLQPSRLPLLVLLIMTVACERALRQYLQIWLPLLDGAMGLPPATPLLGSAEQACWLLRLLCGLTTCVLLMRRLMATRRRDAEDRRVLAAIQLQLEHLAAQQAILTRHILGSQAHTTPAPGPDHITNQPPPLYGQTAGISAPALLVAPTAVAQPTGAPVTPPRLRPKAPLEACTRAEWTGPPRTASCQAQDAVQEAKQPSGIDGAGWGAGRAATGESAEATPRDTFAALDHAGTCTVAPPPQHQDGCVLKEHTVTGTIKTGHSCSKRKREGNPEETQLRDHTVRAKARRAQEDSGR